MKHKLSLNASSFRQQAEAFSLHKNYADSNFLQARINKITIMMQARITQIAIMMQDEGCIDRLLSSTGIDVKIVLKVRFQRKEPRKIGAK